MPASNRDLFKSHKNTPATGVPQEMAGLQAHSQRQLFCQESLWGREIKGLLTHQTRGPGSLNGLKRKLKGNKDSSASLLPPVQEQGHLFPDGARAGSVPGSAWLLHSPSHYPKVGSPPQGSQLTEAM